MGKDVTDELIRAYFSDGCMEHPFIESDAKAESITSVTTVSQNLIVVTWFPQVTFLNQDFSNKQ